MSPERLTRALIVGCALLMTVCNLSVHAAQDSPEKLPNLTSTEPQASAAGEAKPGNVEPIQPGANESEASKTSNQSETDLTAPDDAAIGNLEQKYFGSNFEKDTLNDRITRLEKFVFGGPSKADSQTRLKRLLKVLTARKGPFSAHSVDSNPAPTKNESAPQSPELATSTTKANPGTASSSSSIGQPSATPAPAKKKNLLAIINRGIDNYNKHRYHNAEDDFNEAVDMAPGLARTYAYLGVTLLQLNERTSAMDAMQAAYELDPFGTFGRYAKNCLIILAGDEEIRRRGPRDDKKTVEQVLNKINNQSSSDAGRFSKTANAAATDRQNTTARFTNRLAGELYSPDGSNEYALRSNYAQTDSRVQAANAQKDATLRAAYSKEAANNLKMLLTTKILPGGSRLRAFGTTLNTRYYGSETRNLAPWYIPREYPPELKAQAKTIRMQSLKQPAKQHHSNFRSTSKTTARPSKNRNKRIK